MIMYITFHLILNFKKNVYMILCYTEAVCASLFNLLIFLEKAKP